ncbi:hypothetical protein F4604DRAFT_1543649, partial [Suillus subluteus]
VRRLLKDTFSISQDADFIVHQPAICEDVYSYKYEDGPGPDTQNLAFDLTHGSNIPWNAKILNMLIKELQRRNMEEQAKILQHVIKLKDDEDNDLPAWMWLEKLIKTLGDGGMSSEESNVENDLQCVLQVKKMAWHRRIERELNVIDHQRVLDDDVF